MDKTAVLVVIAELPGSGKSTVAEQLGMRLGYPTVSVDPIESAILSAGIARDQPTGPAAYLVAETIADAELAQQHSVIVDAVNAVNPAREQWVSLAEKHGDALKTIEPTWHAVEQSLDEYADWTGPSADIDRITLDSVESLYSIVEKAIEFLAA